MTLTKDDLQAIGQVVDEKLAPIVQRLDRLDERVGHLEEKVDHLDEKVGHLEEKVDHLDERVSRLEEKVDHLDERVSRLEEKVDHLDKRVSRLEEKVDELQTEMIYVKKSVGHLEYMVMSEEIPRLRAIESCYVGTFERYRYYADKMAEVIEDVERLKRVASDHSRRLQRIESVC